MKRREFPCYPYHEGLCRESITRHSVIAAVNRGCVGDGKKVIADRLPKVAADKGINNISEKRLTNVFGNSNGHICEKDSKRRPKLTWTKKEPIFHSFKPSSGILWEL